MQTTLQETLIQNFEEIKSRNGHYTYRSYAKKLGISSGALSEILKGKRKVSKKLALKIAINLDLKETEMIEFLEPFSDPLNPNRQTHSIEFCEIDMKSYEVLSEWHHFALLSLVKTKGFKNDPDWIAKRLDISVSKIYKAISPLLDLGYLTQKDGVLSRAKGHLSSPDGITNLSLQKAHKKNLELASQAIDTVPIELRDLCAMTMAIDPSKLGEAKKRIRSFLDDISEFLESGSQKEVYKICTQIIPLTKQEKIQ